MSLIVGSSFKGEGVNPLVGCTDVGDVAGFRVGRAAGLVGDIDIPSTSISVQVVIEDGPTFVFVLAP